MLILCIAIILGARCVLGAFFRMSLGCSKSQKSNLANSVRGRCWQPVKSGGTHGGRRLTHGGTFGAVQGSMPERADMLTDTAIRKAKVAGKPLKLFDGGGLFILVAPTGGKLWRLKYRFAGKEKLLSLGGYPEVSLADARLARDEARKLLHEGTDPSAKRQAEKAARVAMVGNSFEAIAREWHAKFSDTWAPSHSDRIIRLFERDVFPWIGARPISQIAAIELLGVLRRIEERGALETAHRARVYTGVVFRYAIHTGRADHDPTSDLRGALPPKKNGHFAAVTEPEKLGRSEE